MRSGATEVAARAAIVAIVPLEIGTRVHHFTRAVLRRTTIHLLPIGAGTATVADAIIARTTLRRRHRRAHLISAAAEILIVPAIRCGTELVHHLTMRPAHTERTLAKLRTTGAICETIFRTLHPRRKSTALGSPALLAKTPALLIATHSGLRAVTTGVFIGAGVAPLFGRVVPAFIRGAIRLAHGPAFTAEAAFARPAFVHLRTGFLIARLVRATGFWTARHVLMRRWILLRRLRGIFLSAERPRGKRERGCGDEYRFLFHIVWMWVHRTNAATLRFCLGRICQSARAELRCANARPSRSV